LCVFAAGCGSKLSLAPVEGKVLYHGKPLEFGRVVFQPQVGPPATGTIQPDGTFRLTTDQSDGAVIGKHQVEITCFDSQRPGAPAPTGEAGAGQSLIPLKYASFHSSGLTAEVKAANEPFVFDLTD